ncbi:uncharacterized protein B0H18DRAFT_315255 [Fomitopsis serialis]|uniref:uncharacterized protein n=1 Tax=Fomitopsis serialis TaxID=139415 RepID=UPI0020086413|nr:uncharacterized protein B0H18DRAFT_315255 [Neoantrodia serialis]KAH9936180.1 hypothetical protein B0H18DRAFT_315255 [Neoantrodia serialis]
MLLCAGHPYGQNTQIPRSVTHGIKNHLKYRSAFAFSEATLGVHPFSMAERHNPSQLDVHIEHLEGEFAPQLMYEEDSLITVSASAPAIPAQPGHETTEDWNMEQWFAGLPSGDLLLDYDLPMLFDEPIDVDVNGEEFLAAFTQAIMEAPPLGGRAIRFCAVWAGSTVGVRVGTAAVPQEFPELYGDVRLRPSVYAGSTQYWHVR